MFRRLFDVGLFEHLGLALGLAGLGLCWIAQRAMGASWRVRIIEANRTELIWRVSGHPQPGMPGPPGFRDSVRPWAMLSRWKASRWPSGTTASSKI